MYFVQQCIEILFQNYSYFHLSNFFIAGHTVGSINIYAIINLSQIMNLITKIAIGENILIGQYFGVKNELHLLHNLHSRMQCHDLLSHNFFH